VKHKTALLIILIAGLLLASCTVQTETIEVDTANPEEGGNEAIGSVDDVTVSSSVVLTDTSGSKKTVMLKNNGLTYIYLWNTWCSGYDESLDVLNDIYEKYGNIINIYAVNTGNSCDFSETDNNASSNYNFPVLFDTDGIIASQYNISSFPTSIIVNESGNVIGMIEGDAVYESIVSLIEYYQ
jgi:thiol-disulfide isomerase/thioredoxin